MSPTATRAARLHAHGEPLKVEEVDLPEVGPDEVMVDMAYAGLNPVDRYTALGRVAADGPLPRTLGAEGAGWVDGRAVVMHGHGLGTRRDGLWADRAVVPRAALSDVPDGVDLAAAAALGIAGATAWRTAHDLARVTDADRVLVLGASGGVGSILLSIMGAVGARAWGQTGSAEKAAWIEEQGAEHVVVGDATEVGRQAAELRPTVVFDPLGDGFTGAAMEVLEPFGRLVLFGTSAGEKGEVHLQQLYRKGISVLGYAGLIEPPERLQAAMRGALADLAAGRLRVPVDDAASLEDINDALRRLEQRLHRGKLVVRLAASGGGGAT